MNIYSEEKVTSIFEFFLKLVPGQSVESGQKKRVWLDVLALSLALPAIGLLFNPHDIFFLKTAFPWLIIAPVMLSVWYGLFWGGVGVLITVLYFFIATFYGQLPDTSVATQLLVGLVILVFITGEISGRWREKNKLQHDSMQKAVHRATKLDKSMQLLQISHSRMERFLVNEHQSLANTLRLLEFEQLRHSHQAGAVKISDLITKLHDVFSCLNWIDSAAFIAIRPSGMIGELLATKGNFSVDDFMDDALFVKVINNKKPYMQPMSKWPSSAEKQNGLTAVFPIIDQKQGLIGVLAVEQIKANAFNKQNMNLLLILCQYLSGIVGEEAENQQQPNVSLLAQEISSSIQIVNNTVRSAMLVVVNIDHSEQSKSFEAFFVSNTRCANRIWYVSQGGRGTSLLMLFPMFMPNDFEHYQQKLQHTFTKKYQTSLDGAGIRLRDYCLSGMSHKQALHSHLKNILTKVSYAKMVR